ncbi:FAD-dependent oxidoreductase [Agaribacter flavus]|uniref:FAD-dependent oxidoreductase n=1 Tax=Agaribacter flavus TaxID=1902781 RepID=A0ABV7FNU1_9ALTE
MTLAVETPQASNTSETVPYDLIVVGNGPVGVHFVNQLHKQGYEGSIAVFGEEECGPYNRVKLSSFLNGDMPLSALDNPINAQSNIVEHLHCRIENIDPALQIVTDQQGISYRFKKLVLATGSTPHVPQIEGSELTGVYCFRNMKDTQALYARRLKSRTTVVIGGGLLGLETAKAMLKYSTEVLLVHHSPRLMNRQLDDEAARRLQDYAESTGIKVRVGCQVSKIVGERTVQSIVINNTEEIICDTVIFTTGIRPSTQLAMDARITVNRGIKIDETLSTSAQNIYAIGECADFNGQVYGLVAPGLEQASILANNLTGKSFVYKGASLITELKVMGLSVFSMGLVGEEYEAQIDENIIYQDEEVYRRLLLYKGRLVGAICVGDSPELKQLQKAVESRARVLPWNKKRFMSFGRLFSDKSTSPASFSDNTVICNCQQVTAGQIRQCAKLNNNNIAIVEDTLGVSKVCGTCKPLVQAMLDQKVEQLPVKKVLLVSSILAAIVAALLVFLPSPLAPQSVQDTNISWLWTDGLARQISGFVILGLTALGLLFSLRKRMTKITWLSFDFWRGWHVILTAIALATLFAHTGISMGEGINRWLIVNFVAIIAVGVLSGITASMEGYWASSTLKSIKRKLVWGHILAFWPFPILLAYHVLSVYYF